MKTWDIYKQKNNTMFPSTHNTLALLQKHVLLIELGPLESIGEWTCGF
jgi:hypothetical protein